MNPSSRAARLAHSLKWRIRTRFKGMRFYAILRDLAWTATCAATALLRQTLGRGQRVVTVVGSLGKTTTVRALMKSFGSDPDKVRYNHHFGVAWAFIRNIWRQQIIPIEVGIDGPGQMLPYARMLRPDLVVVTSIGVEHTRAFGTLENTRQEKALMLKGLQSGGVAVLNGDDPHVRWMATQTRARVVSFGFGPSNMVRAEDLVWIGPAGMRFKLQLFDESYPMTTLLLGRHQIYSLLAAATVAKLTGHWSPSVLQRLSQLEAAPGRLQVHRLPNDITILGDDHKATYESLVAALDVFESIPARRKLAVVATPSDSPLNRRETCRFAGERLGRVAAFLIVIGANWRDYRAGAHRAGLPREAVLNAGSSCRKAAGMLRDILQPGDLLLVKGRTSQHLLRVILHLQGQKVRCDLSSCSFRRSCSECPYC